MISAAAPIGIFLGRISNFINSELYGKETNFAWSVKFKNVDFFLLDYKPEIKELPGGNAKQFDWNLIKNLKMEKPWFISGGIN